MTDPLVYSKAISANDQPRQDYHELALRLGGKLIAPDTRHLALLRYTWWLEQRLKFHLAEAVRVSLKLSEGQVVVSTSEKVGLPLANVLRLRQQHTPHLLIAHKLSSPRKRYYFKNWPLSDYVQRVVCVSQAQAVYATTSLGMPAARVDFLYDKVDQLFFSPQTAVSDNYLLAVGQEQRDYNTLLQAIKGTKLPLVIVNSSLWANQHLNLNGSGQANVKILAHISFRALRDLYAGARLVVLPLFDSDYAAGVNVALEAMAMGRPLIVSQTGGLGCYFVPGQTAVTVPPADPIALREAILALWHDDGARQRLGTNARQAIEEKMTLDHYVNRLCQIVTDMSG